MPKRAARLGTQTGSLINHVISGSKDAEPVVGMGATTLMWSDRHAHTIVGVSADKKIIAVQQDNAKRTDKNGMSDSQDYEYSRNPDAPIDFFTLRKNGAWVRAGESIKGTRISVGERMEFYDYSF